MADAEAKTTLDPTEAKFFTFEVNTGEVSVSIADSKSMKVFYAKDITDGMTEDVMNDWQEFLKELRFFAKRHMMTFDPRDIQKSNLDKDQEVLKHFSLKMAKVKDSNIHSNI